MDPFSPFTLGAAIGGVSGKLAEKAWDSGEKWLNTFFDNHSEKVQLKARTNSLDFLTELANRVKALDVNRNKKCSDFGKIDYSDFGNSPCSKNGNKSAVTDL